MNTSFNKKKFSFLPSTQLIKILIFFIFLIILLFLIYDELSSKKRYKEFLQIFSEKYNYQLESYDINTIYRADKVEIIKIINKYLDQSIFLIPLNDISEQIHNLKWIKGV